MSDKGMRVGPGAGGEADMRGVFDTLIDAIAVFRGSACYAHPQGNYRGCYIGPDRKDPKPFKREFRFVTRHGHEVVMGLDFRLAAVNPELYFTNLLEHLDAAMKQVNAGGTVFLPARGATMSTAVKAANEGI